MIGSQRVECVVCMEDSLMITTDYDKHTCSMKCLKCEFEHKFSTKGD